MSLSAIRSRRLPLGVSLFLLLLLLSIPLILFAAPGDRDHTFGSGGTVVTDVVAGAERIYDVALQPLTYSVSNIDDLVTFAVYLSYDPAAVQPQGTVNETIFGSSLPTGFSTVTCSSGTCEIVATRLRAAGPISGSFDLFTLNLLPLSF